MSLPVQSHKDIDILLLYQFSNQTSPPLPHFLGELSYNSLDTFLNTTKCLLLTPRRLFATHNFWLSPTAASLPTIRPHSKSPQQRSGNIRDQKYKIPPTTFFVLTHIAVGRSNRKQSVLVLRAVGCIW